MKIKFNRILWLVPDSASYVYSSNEKGLELLGATVELFDYREEVLKVGVCKVREEILKTIEDFAPDLVLSSFYSNNYELPPEFLLEISSRVPLVVFSGDDELYGTWQTVYLAQAADAVITFDIFGRHVFEQLSIPTIHYFFPSLDFEIPSPCKEKTIDVSFVGNCKKSDRGEYIRFLRENGINVSTYGQGSDNGFVSREESLKIISQSKINLNFTKSDVASEILVVEPWRANILQVKARPIEVAKMNSFCLSEYSPGLDKMFSIGNEVGTFYDKEELLVKVKYYLQHDAERQEMAARAFEKAKSDYDNLGYLCRTFNLLHEKLQNNKGRTKKVPVFRSFDFNSSEVKANFFIFLMLLRLNRFVLAIGVVPYFLNLKLSCLVGLWRGVAELVSNRFCGRK
jgi:spore maturation protein CgeB